MTKEKENKTTGSTGVSRKTLKEFGLFLADILYNALIIIILVILIRTFLISPFRVVGSSMADNLESDEFILIDKLSYRLSEPKRGDAIVFHPPITDKYPHKFEEAVTTDTNGIGILDIKNLTTAKNAVYCQNELVKSLWFCEEKVYKNDLVYYRPVKSGSDSDPGVTWVNAVKKQVSEDEIKSGRLIINGEPNQSYLIRIYSSIGPEYFVKRIMGIPGDTIKIENGRVYLKTKSDNDFTEIHESYLNEENKNSTYLNQRPDDNTFTVPDGKYFLMGDNRTHSNDSRSWFSPIDQDPAPYVPSGDISGKVFVVLWPLKDIRFISSGNI
jgi:signal peptidase I